jgi:hypothetical protein
LAGKGMLVESVETVLIEDDADCDSCKI